MTDYLALVEVLAIHDDQLERYGGTAGIRDLGLVEASLFRPQTGYYADIIEEAAALWESFGQNHPFVDGNKRTGLAAADTFLYFNGLDMEAEEEELLHLVTRLAAGKIDEDGAATFFRDHAEPLAKE